MVKFIHLDKEINMNDLATMLKKYPKDQIISDFSSARSYMYLIISLGKNWVGSSSD